MREVETPPAYVFSPRPSGAGRTRANVTELSLKFTALLTGGISGGGGGGAVSPAPTKN